MTSTKNAKPKVLIVDDVAENLHVMMSILREEFAVIAATNGERALQLASAKPAPALILLDINMPGMDGYEVLRQLKDDPETADIPVIFITALTDDVNEARGLDLGAVDYITKPVNPTITLLKIRHQISLKMAQQELHEKEEMLRTITNAVQSAVVLIDDQEVIQFANPAAEKMFGYARDELKGKNVHDTLTPGSMRKQAKNAFRVFTGRGEGPALDKPLELLARRKDNSEVQIELYVSRIQQGDNWWAVGAAIDITKHKKREAKLVDQAETDALTGVRNRRSFMQLAENILNNRRRTEENTQLFFLMFDLDHFKYINDAHGHGVGDEVLRSFAGICVQNLRDSDLFARIGGEEFAAVIRSKKLEDAVNVAERIRIVFYDGTQVDVGDNNIHVDTSVSIGLVQIDPKSESVESGLKRADVALYQAKSLGRNRVISIG